MRTGKSSGIGFAALIVMVAGLALAPAAGALSSNGKTVDLSISCTGTPGAPGTPGSSCSGTVSLTAKNKKTKQKTITVGSTSFSLAAGQQSTVPVGLNGRGRKILRKLRKLRVTLQVSTASAVSAPATLKIKLKKRKK